jgi:hypothetical protein
MGQIPLLLATPTSVGGTPDGGVPKAIELILGALRGGAIWYVRSDIKEFFTKIPREPLRDFLSANISDPAFMKLFDASLSTELANHDDEAIRIWWNLFPDYETGVPQGSALSALCANLILRDFDLRLNSNGVTMIRYLDDFLILGSSKRAVEKAWSIAEALLADLGMDAHDPEQGSGKASKGQIADGFDFLSFRINTSSVAPSAKAKADFLRDVRLVIAESKTEILANPGATRRREDRFVQTLSLLDSKIRGWGDAFRESNQRLAFSQLDSQIAEAVDGFIGWFIGHAKGKSAPVRMRMWGMTLLADTPRAKIDPEGRAALANG